MEATAHSGAVAVTTPVRLTLALVAVLVAIFTTWAIASPGADDYDWLFAGALYNVAMLGGALLCFMRAAAVRSSRAWRSASSPTV